jgi:hypothetical protein
MSKELGYVLITPYTLRKSRTGGVFGRLISSTGLDLVAARMFGPSTELVTRYAAQIRDDETVWPEIRELLPDYILREFAPTDEGQCHRVLMLLFEGEDDLRIPSKAQTPFGEPMATISRRWMEPLPTLSRPYWWEPRRRP